MHTAAVGHLSDMSLSKCHLCQLVYSITLCWVVINGCDMLVC